MRRLPNNSPSPTILKWLLALALALCLAGPAGAQSSDPLSRTYITPFPEGDVYKVFMLGDWLSDGVWQGLVAELDDEAQVEVLNKTDGSGGIGRNDGKLWDKIAEDLAVTQPVQVAVLFFGLADRSWIRVDGKRRALGSDEWIAEYGQRVERIIKVFKRRNVAVYWLGLPITRGQESRKAFELMNSIFREKCLIAGIRFIDTWEGFADQSGAYSDYGPDMSGKTRQLRTDDGIGFTQRGFQKLAHFAAREIRRDLALARSERDVPLAGDEEEQRQILASLPAAAVTGSIAETGPSMPGAGPATPAILPGVRDLAEETAKVALVEVAEGGVRKETSVEIVRPSIPAAVVSHLLRSRSARAYEFGDTLPTELNGGLTAMSSVAMSTEGGGEAGTREPVTQSAYYKVLVKGEPLPPKPDRADDFSWPR